MDSTWKYEHLFPVWSLLLSGCSRFPHITHREQHRIRKMDQKYHEVHHWQSALHHQEIFPPPPFKLIQWKWQHHLLWSATHNVGSWEINPWKCLTYWWDQTSDPWWLGQIHPLALSALFLTAWPLELTNQLSNITYYYLINISEGYTNIGLFLMMTVDFFCNQRITVIFYTK